MNIKDILLIITIIYVFYLHSKINNIKKIENFALSSDDKNEVRALIKEIYNTDMDAIRTLAKMADDIQRNGLEVKGNLIVTGSITNSGNISTTGNLSGNNITSNNNVFNLLPTGIILAYNSTSAPAGWILCDGTKGTPDLRGRFILGTACIEKRCFSIHDYCLFTNKNIVFISKKGTGQGSGLTNRIINNTGGAETHTLTVRRV